MAQNAKEYAKSQLGDLDLSYLEKEREASNNAFNTSNSSLENNFNNLLSQINTNRVTTRKNFNTGRSTVSENAFMNNRSNNADLASRGVGTGGLQKLGEVGNRIETGRQYSNLANEFYDTMGNLANTEKQGRSQFDIDKQTIKNTLESALAGIGSREGEAKNNYNMSLGNLAEQIQGRWDSNANAQAALKQQQAAANQAHADALAASKQQNKAYNTGILNNLTSLMGSKKQDGSTYGYDDFVNGLITNFNVNRDFARNIADELGFGNNKSFSFDINNQYQPNQYLNQLKGMW